MFSELFLKSPLEERETHGKTKGKFLGLTVVQGGSWIPAVRAAVQFGLTPNDCVVEADENDNLTISQEGHHNILSYAAGCWKKEE